MRGATAVFAIAGLAGCYAPSVHEGLPCSPAGECPDGLRCGPDQVCVADPADAAGSDGARTIDAIADASGAPDACTSCGMVIARYRFEGTLADATGAHPAAQVGDELAFVAGVDGGEAVHIPLDGTSWIRVEDSPAFDVPAGRVTLAFQIGSDAPDGDLGLVSRDAVQSATDGHFGIRIGHDRRVVARLQQISDPTVQAYRCTMNPVTETVWHDVEVEFGDGGFVLRVDGAVATGTVWTDLDGVAHPCTDAWTRGIAGNDNPWVFGALTALAAEGTGAPVSAVAADVALDEIVIEAL